MTALPQTERGLYQLFGVAGVMAGSVGLGLWSPPALFVAWFAGGVLILATRREP